MQWALVFCTDGLPFEDHAGSSLVRCVRRRAGTIMHTAVMPKAARSARAGAALRRVFDNILSNAAKYSAGDLTVTLTPDGAVTFANHAPNLSCVQANQLFDRFFTVETARALGRAGERGSGTAARRSPASAAAGKAPGTLRRATVFDPEVAFRRTVLRENPAPLDNIHRLYAIMTLLLCGCGRSGSDPLC